MATITVQESKLDLNLDEAVRVTWTNDTGTAVVVGEIIGIKEASGKRVAARVEEAIANGSSGTVSIYGRYTIAKSTAVSFAQFALVYWDVSANKASTLAVCNQHGDFCVGWAAAAAATAATYVQVDFNKGSQKFNMGSSSSSSSSSST